MPGLLGWGEHWPLDADEKKRAGDALAEAFDTLPDNNAAAKVTELLGNALPWIGLSGTMFGIFAPRLAMTKLVAQQKDQEIAQANTNTGEPVGFPYAAYSSVPHV